MSLEVPELLAEDSRPKAAISPDTANAVAVFVAMAFAFFLGRKSK